MAGVFQSVARLLRALGEPRRPAIRSHLSTEAEARAIRLLIHDLSPSQRQQYLVHGYFDVIGGATGKRYRIHYGPQMNVEELDCNGRRVHRLCFMPQGGLPIGDIMLAQKIALELFEEEALWVANRADWDFEHERNPRRRRRLTS